ncbi:MAG: AMP-binding protein [Desulfomonile tiedjei]|uniref:AMP-binding protein n=1 Tax=Desulfomonile tiedjei TaxID=2358 RepID=A0A9D6Z4V5_9BACT|nr:AMP-binding protein [Desulfomonile tiedjei]
MNLSEIVDRFALDMPDHPALVFEDLTVSYGDLLSSINKLANALTKAGVRQGDRLAILLGNRPEFVAGYFACLRMGAIAVTLNPLSTAYELSHYFSDCKPAGVICKSDQIEKIQSIPDRAEYLKLIITTEPSEGTVSYEEIQRDFSDKFAALDLDPDHPAVVIFTAGLLGRALGATLSHRNLDSNSNMLRDDCGGGPEQRGLALIPLFHAFGAAVNLLGTLKVGGTVYLVERVDFPKLVPWLKAAQITYSGMVPMVYYGLLYHPSCRDLDLTSLKIGISGGAPLSMEIYEKFCERYKIDIYQGYGLTEASPVVSWNNVTIPNKPPTVGKPIPGVVVAIHDEDGKPVPVGARGEVVLKGPNVMLGYLGKSVETETVIREGWLYTGDLGFLDEDGYITLNGLKKDLIITSGFNVYCQEVEEILIRHSHVADVALVGVEDLMRGQVIEALVVPEPGVKPDERDIMRFCREYLSRYKCPRKVTIVKEIRRDAHGKPAGWS